MSLVNTTADISCKGAGAQNHSLSAAGAKITGHIAKKKHLAQYMPGTVVGVFQILIFSWHQTTKPRVENMLLLAGAISLWAKSRKPLNLMPFQPTALKP